jgi:hypothetical protein
LHQQLPPQQLHSPHMMTCEGFNMTFPPGSLTSHAPSKTTDYPITKVEVNGCITVRALTKYGRVAAYFSDNGTSRVFWTSDKEVVVQECVNQIAQAPQQSLQTGRSEANDAANRAEAAARRAESAAANAATKHPQDSWGVEVDRVTALSARQNGGTPAYVHFCEPKFKVCVDGIGYKNSNGRSAIIMVHRDIHDAMIDRVACQLNEREDIRFCIDFDTGAKTTGMKGTDGEWQDVNDDETATKKAPEGDVPSLIK